MGEDVDAGRRDGGTGRDGGDPVEDGGAEDDATMPPVDGGPVDGGPPLPSSCVTPAGADPTGTTSWDDTLGRATVSIGERDACRRSYTLTTTATLRDGQPSNPRTVVEQEGLPTTRTGHDLFDALHALALAEVGECSVESIRDGAFNDGAGVACGAGGCFETGRLWNYVWTRDTAYSVDLGLAAIDPTRSLNSLSFKLSERRGGGDLQIVQDTGSGGSYPVSTDRVAWALGAWELLRHLDGTAREQFAARAYDAVRNTIEHDREVVFDEEDGLYRGEQSFLDWREQTYPEWTATDVVHLGMSKSLGTNLLHLRALELAAMLAEERSESAAVTRYRGFADALRTAIRTRFWLEDEGMFSTFVTTGLDPAPTRRFDLLASAFAVLFDVATEAQATRILQSYPHYGPGAPVIWPQQQQTPIYHNRGEWPFVTAYWLRAAKHANNDAVAAKMMRALIRGAAVNLSNMENFEAATGAPWLDEGATSGPVVNSQRQLWSVAGYLSMVHHTLFGLEATDEGLAVRPYVPASLRSSLFAGTDELVLNDYPYLGGRVTVVLHLPESAGTGALRVTGVRLDGSPLTGDVLTEITGAHRVDVDLAAGTGNSTLTEVSTASWQNVFGPRTPRITALSEVGGRVRLTLSTSEAADVTFRIYRDGTVVADELAGTTTSWTDMSFDAGSARTPCYVVETTFTSSGNHSQHSPPQCWWGASAARVTSFGASAMTNVGGTAITNHGRFHYENWGDEGHTLTTPSFTATQTGEHLLQLVYGNGAGAINTGITCAVKRVVAIDVATGSEVGDGIVSMPHLGTWDRWADSSLVPVMLQAGRSYRFEVRGDERAVNMSSFAHFEAYTGGMGGRSGVFNRVNVAELKVLAR
ncbi:MAG: hypothetical protein H6722_00820 [Sandaracinus sp.]|nr:hypothetical protein [Sandaracinus sp.]